MADYERDHSGPGASGEITPAVDAAELLAQRPETDVINERPREKDLIGERFYRDNAAYVQRGREARGLLTEDGRLDLDAKFDQSAYEILTRDFYERAIVNQQGVGMPDYPTDEELREFFVMKAEKLIEHVIDSEADVLFFLDKSARPVAWMMRDLWPLFAPKDAPMPEMKILNIDANDVLGIDPDSDVRPNEAQVSEFQPTEQQINQIRSIYEHVPHTADFPQEYQTAMRPHHPEDFQHAMIIDEVSVTGSSMRIAEKLVRSAFPSLQVESASWIGANVKPVGRRGYESAVATTLPPWYAKHYTQGRGIGAPHTDNPFLSKPMRPPGVPEREEILSEALRTDMELLARDIRDGRQSVRPIIGCYQTDPDTGEELEDRPKYKLATFRGKQRVITPPYEQAV